MVVGDNQPFIASLITIDQDMLKGWIAANSKTGATLDALVNDPDLIAVIQTAVDDAHEAVSKAESIRKFVILPGDFTIAGGELTAKLSLKRHIIAQKYASEISALYTK
jgi:long-chain acyl-CoA synthetase